MSQLKATRGDNETHGAAWNRWRGFQVAKKKEKKKGKKETKERREESGREERNRSAWKTRPRLMSRFRIFSRSGDKGQPRPLFKIRNNPCNYQIPAALYREHPWKDPDSSLPAVRPSKGPPSCHLASVLPFFFFFFFFFLFPSSLSFSSLRRRRST